MNDISNMDVILAGRGNFATYLCGQYCEFIRKVKDSKEKDAYKTPGWMFRFAFNYGKWDENMIDYLINDNDKMTEGENYY